MHVGRPFVLPLVLSLLVGIIIGPGARLRAPASQSDMSTKKKITTRNKLFRSEQEKKSCDPKTLLMAHNRAPVRAVVFVRGMFILNLS